MTTRALVLASLAVWSSCSGQTTQATQASARRGPESRPDGESDLGERAMAHVRALVAIGERYSGSAARVKAADLIARTLGAAGLSPERDRWHDPVEKLDFENVTLELPGESDRIIVIATHYDTKHTQGHPDPEHNFRFVGANDGGSGSGLLIELARSLSQRKNRPTYLFAWLDGEESLTWDWNEGARALFGSRRLVQRLQQRFPGDRLRKSVRSMLLLDMVGAAGLTIDEDENSTPELVQSVRAEAERRGLGQFFFKNRLPVKDDHLPFKQAGIPVLDLIDIHDNPEWHTEKDDLASLSPDSLRVVGEVLLGALPEIEKFSLR